MIPLPDAIAGFHLQSTRVNSGKPTQPKEGWETSRHSAGVASRLQKGHFRIKKCCDRTCYRSASRVQADDTVFCKRPQCGLEVMPAYNELAKPQVAVEKRRVAAKNNLSEFTSSQSPTGTPATALPVRPIAPAYPDSGALRAQGPLPGDSAWRVPAPIFPAFFR